MSLAVQARFGRIPARLAARMRKTLGSALGKRWCALGVLAAVLAAPAARARADERVFTYSYEPKVLPKDALEFEQWATLRAGKEDGVFSRWDLRTEFEYGLLDQLTTALYLNFESLHIDRDEEQVDEFEFKGLSSEWKWKFLDPTADPIGVLGYFEATTNFEDVELEEKLVLGKNFDRVVLAFNAICEQEWEFENEETETELAVEFTAGVAFRFTDRFAVGVEAREVNVFPDMENLEHAAVFLGPTLHYNTNRWWATLTFLPQVAGLRGDTQDGLNLDEFERMEVRLIFGIHF
jgi:hypothetical protein